MKVEFIVASHDGTWRTECRELTEGSIPPQYKIKGSIKWCYRVRLWFKEQNPDIAKEAAYIGVLKP